MSRILLIILMVFSVSCGIKNSQRLVNSGDYDSAIDRATGSLRNNKDKKSKQEYILLLELAYAKANERDLREIDLLIKDAHPRNLERIFSTYVTLHNRQESIRPLLPLRIQPSGKEAKFEFRDYSEQIISSKSALSKHLYENAKALIATNDKMNNRRAFDDLQYLDQLNPAYKNVSELINEAQFRGTDYINVYTKNETGMLIPKRLQDDLLDFSTYGLNDKWTVYHSNRQPNIDYDYGIVLNFRLLKVSPDHVTKREFEVEKEILDGKRKQLDRRGQVVLDSLGKPVMIDNYKTVKAVIIENTQQKATQVSAKIEYINFRTNQLLKTFPLASEFRFEHIYAGYRGDVRAIDAAYLPLLSQRPMPFPSNEQMIFDTGEDLKAKLKAIITANRFPK